jgi:hypothetical protein
MSGIILVVTFLLVSSIGIAVVLWLSKKASRDIDEFAEDLEEWTCPVCGFLVQAGDICVYCYTKKTTQSPTGSSR